MENKHSKFPSPYNLYYHCATHLLLQPFIASPGRSHNHHRGHHEIPHQLVPFLRDFTIGISPATMSIFCRISHVRSRPPPSHSSARSCDFKFMVENNRSLIQILTSYATNNSISWSIVTSHVHCCNCISFDSRVYDSISLGFVLW